MATKVINLQTISVYDCFRIYTKKPDTYIGAIETDDLETWALNEDNTAFEHKVVKWVPGLYKCFDEAM